MGMFSGKDVPAVGVSIGIERVFAIMEGQMRERAAASGRQIRATDTQVQFNFKLLYHIISKYHILSFCTVACRRLRYHA